MNPSRQELRVLVLSPKYRVVCTPGLSNHSPYSPEPPPQYPLEKLCLCFLSLSPEPTEPSNGKRVLTHLKLALRVHLCPTETGIMPQLYHTARHSLSVNPFPGQNIIKQGSFQSWGWEATNQSAYWEPRTVTHRSLPSSTAVPLL